MTDSRINYRQIVTALARYKITYVLTGSVAIALNGVPVNPVDFDIAPELSEGNLTRLAALLREWDAKPNYFPDWEDRLTPEQIEAWQPDPPTAEQLNHMMVTPYGKLDIVPSISGDYHKLMSRAKVVKSFGTTIYVAHLDDLIATMKPKSPKHIKRRPHMLEAQHHLQRGTSLLKLESLDGGAFDGIGSSEVNWKPILLLLALIIGLFLFIAVFCVWATTQVWTASDCLHPEPDSTITFPPDFGTTPVPEMTLYIPPSAQNMGSQCMSVQGIVIEFWFDMHPSEMDTFLDKSGIQRPMTPPEEVLYAPGFGPDPRGGHQSGFWYAGRECVDDPCGMSIWIEGTDPNMYRVYVGFSYGDP